MFLHQKAPIVKIYKSWTLYPHVIRFIHAPLASHNMTRAASCSNPSWPHNHSLPSSDWHQWDEIITKEGQQWGVKYFSQLNLKILDGWTYIKNIYYWHMPTKLKRVSKYHWMLWNFLKPQGNFCYHTQSSFTSNNQAGQVIPVIWIISNVSSTS